MGRSKKPKSVKIIPITKITVDVESFEYITNANIAMNERLINDNDILNRISKPIQQMKME